MCNNVILDILYFISIMIGVLLIAIEIENVK